MGYKVLMEVARIKCNRQLFVECIKSLNLRSPFNKFSYTLLRCHEFSTVVNQLRIPIVNEFLDHKDFNGNGTSHGINTRLPSLLFENFDFSIFTVCYAESFQKKRDD